MNDESIIRAVLEDGSYRETKSRTDWEEVGARTDEEVDQAARADADAPPLDDAFWATARIVVPSRIPKRHQSMRLDADVIDWLKAQGFGSQTRMNAVLRSYVEAQKHRQR